MTTKSTNESVKFIPGTRYGGTNQRSLSSSGDERLSKRSQKFMEKRGGRQPNDKGIVFGNGVRKEPRRSVAAEARMVVNKIEQEEAVATLAPIDVERIQWEEKNRKQYVTVNCPQLTLTLKKRMCNPLLSSSSNHLYRAMLSGLQDLKFGVFARLHVIAMGTYPRMKEMFMKLKWKDVLSGQEMEFIVPKSFLQDCKAAIINQHF